MFDHCFIIVSSSIVCTVAASPWNLCLYTEPQRIASPPRTLVEDRLSPGWMRTIFFQRRPSLGCCFLRIAGENVSYFNRFSLQKNVRQVGNEINCHAGEESNAWIYPEWIQAAQEQNASKAESIQVPYLENTFERCADVIRCAHLNTLAHGRVNIRNVMKCAISVIAIPQNSRGHSKVGK